MRLLVTGATGFLGERLCRRLSLEGAEVVATGRDPLKLSRLKSVCSSVVAADLSKAEDLARLSGRSYDAIVHCAALSSPWGALSDFVSANVVATQNVSALCEAIAGCRLVHISSPAIYFRPRDQVDISETDELPRRPVNHYARTKLAAEKVVRDSGSPFIILRPRGIYGPGDTALLPRLIKAAEARPLPLLRGGRARTDLTHVDDVVSAIRASILAPNSALRATYNISGGEALSIKGIIESACYHAGIDLSWKVVPAHLASVAAQISEGLSACRGWREEPLLTRYSVGLLSWSQTLDISQARRALSWEPEIAFEEGLQETLRASFP